MRSVGIDIGSYSVKVAVLDSTSKGIQLVSYLEKVILSQNKFDRDLEVIEFLRDHSSIFDATQIKIVTGLRQSRTSLRTKNFPFRDRNKIIKSLPFELEEEMPFASDDTIFDGRIIRHIGNSSDVLAVAAPKEPIKAQMQLLSDSGVETQIITPDGMALGNLVEAWQNPPDILPENTTSDNGYIASHGNCEILVHFGHHQTLLLLFDGSRVLDVRSIIWGTEKLIKAISDTYSIPSTEAAKQLQSKGFILISKAGATNDQVAYSNLMQEGLKSFVRDLKLTILEFKSVHNCDINQVLISGGASRVQNIAAYITQGIELPVNRFNPFSQIQVSATERSPAMENASPVALGLALEGLRRPKNPAINLLRGDLAKQSSTFNLIWDKWGTTAKYLSASILLMFVYASFLETTAMEMSDKAQEVMKSHAKTVAGLQGSKANESNLRKFIKEKRNIANEINAVVGLASMNSSLELLKKVSDALPPRNLSQFEVSFFEVRDEKIHLQGVANSQKEVESILQSLKKLSGTSGHRSASPNIPVQAGKLAFAFEFEMDRNLKKKDR